VAAPKSMAWLAVIGTIVLALVGLSFVALDKDNVVWRDGKAICPHCRTAVPFYAKRCPTCREEFDWVTPTDDEDSPVCAYCLSPGEDDLLRARKKELGDVETAKKVAAALSITEAAAAEYLKAAGRGQCAWCGGSGKDLSALEARDAVCPVCFGAKRCAFCGGDRRVKIGSEAAGRDISRYRVFVEGLAGDLAPATSARRDLAGRAEAFLKVHAGEQEAAELLFAPGYERTGAGVPQPKRASDVAADRVEKLVRELK
jgi:hypothetical protein